MPSRNDFFLDIRYRWAITLSLAIFLYVFLITFLPFGVDNYNPSHQYTAEFLLEMAKFMVGILIIAGLLEVLLKPLFVRTTTTLAVILWNVTLMIVLGIGVFLLYNWLGNWHDFNVKSGLAFIANCASIFIFPLLGTFFYFRFQGLKHQVERINSLQAAVPSEMQKLQFTGAGTQDKLLVNAHDFCYAQAQDNYVSINYFRNNTLQTTLLRMRLGEVLEQSTAVSFIRCHRSFVINPGRVHSYQGGNPLKLFLEGIEDPIPVSRSYRQAVLQELKRRIIQE